MVPAGNKAINAFHRSTIPQKQFIIVIIVAKSLKVFWSVKYSEMFWDIAIFQFVHTTFLIRKTQLKKPFTVQK